MLGQDRFLYCRDCNEVHKVTPFDQAPIYDFMGSDIREIPTDDRRQFTARHADHSIEELISVTEDWFNPQDTIDPMAESFLVAANNSDFMIIHRTRRSIAETIVYRVMPRQLCFWPSGLDRPALKRWTRDWRTRWRRGKIRLHRNVFHSQFNQLTLFTAADSAH